MWLTKKHIRVQAFLPVLALLIACCILGFGVTASTVSADGEPTVTAVNPATGNQGATLNVAITGTNLTGTTQVTFTGDGITVNNFNVNSPTLITANISIAADAGASLRNVYVLNGSGQGDLSRGFGVTCQVGISIAGATHANVAEDSIFDLRITASKLANFTAYVVYVTYDAIVLEVIGGQGSANGVTAGNIGGTSVSVDSWTYIPSGTPGTIKVFGQVPSASLENGINGDGYFAEAHIHVRGYTGQNSNFSLSGIELWDNNGFAIPTVAQNGSVTIIGAPSITSVSPSSGPVTGGTAVTIAGTNFQENETTVSIGGNPAANVTVVSDVSLTAITPAGTAGAKSVVVTTPAGSDTLPGGFRYIPPPAITSFSPEKGGTGTTVTINGTNLGEASAITFGGTPAVINTKSATKITAVIGTGSTGVVSVTTPGGTAATMDEFTYFPAPSITSFTPTQGGTGTVVTIEGTNLNGATAVLIGGKAADGFNLVSDTQITAAVGSGSTGKVQVTTPGGTANSDETFTYYATPKISSFTPVLGGSSTNITIKGTNLGGATSVTIGGIAVFAITSNSATKITATVGEVASGPIVVTTPGGAATSKKSFTYYGAPSITSFAPASGGKNTLITITGINFNGAKTVTIGGTKAASFKVDSDNQITAKAGSGSTGTISVTTPGGTAASLDSFTYYGVPKIKSFIPAAGGNGTVLTITGTNFSGASAVTIGGTPAVFSVDSPAQITAVAGIGAPGKVSVTTPGGSSSSSKKFAYYYQPVIDSVSPYEGGKGTAVTITGENLKGATAVSFGGTPAASFKFSGNKIIAKLGAGSSGIVSVTTPGGTAQSASIFTYYLAPTITSFSPTQGGPGMRVTINGTNLEGTKEVTIGNKATFNLTVESPTQVSVEVGSGATGKIKVTTPGGSATSTAKFTFYKAPVIKSFTPPTGGSGDFVTINGSNFVKGATEVKIGGRPATIETISTTRITVKVGSGSTGRITVTTPGGTAASSIQFTYEVKVGVDAPSSAVTESEFVVRINISEVSDLAGYDFHLNYDPAVLSVTEVTKGMIGASDLPLDDWGFIPANTQGKIMVFGHVDQFNPPYSLSGAGYLASIKVIVIGKTGDSSDIYLSGITLLSLDPNGRDLHNIEISETINTRVLITAAL